MEPGNEEFMKKWGTFFEEFRETKETRLFYAIYFARRLMIGCLIMFVHTDVLQLVVSIAVTLSVSFT